MNIPHYKKLALQKHKEHRKFLEGLKKKPPKNLDYMSLETHEEVFAEVNCLSCANCCKTTGPLFTAKDIERLAKLFRLKPAEFEQKYLKTDEDGDIILQQVPCVFLMQIIAVRYTSTALKRAANIPTPTAGRSIPLIILRSTIRLFVRQRFFLLKNFRPN